MKKIKVFMGMLVAAVMMSACGPFEDNPLFHKIRVEDFTVEAVNLENGTVTLTAGDELQLVITVYPFKADEPTVEYFVSDEEVLRVTPEGLIQALSAGTVTITIVSTDRPEINQTITVTVVDSKVEIDERTKVDQAEAEARRR